MNSYKSAEIGRTWVERFRDRLPIAIGGVTLAGLLTATFYEPAEHNQRQTVEQAVAENIAASAVAAPVETPLSPPVTEAPAPPPPPLPPEMLNPPCVKSPIPWMPHSVSRWYPFVAQSAKIHAVPAEPLELLEFIESFGNPRAKSAVGALGLIQIMPDTAAGLSASLGLPVLDLWDPASNIYLAGKYFRRYIDDGSIDVSQGFTAESMRQLAIVYNGGPGRLKNYKTIGFDSLPNETKLYANRAVLAWEERYSPTSQVLNEYMSMSGPRNLQAAGANIGTPPCQ
jgi:hypothetical protein